MEGVRPLPKADVWLVTSLQTKLQTNHAAAAFYHMLQNRLYRGEIIHKSHAYPGEGASNQAERECLEAIYAYERVLTEKHKKKTRASRTWQMVKRHGILGAVERAVNRKDETIGYTALVEMGLEGYAFEAVVVRYPSLFSPEAVERSKARISERASN